jgi:hypothetical protein
VDSLHLAWLFCFSCFLFVHASCISTLLIWSCYTILAIVNFLRLCLRLVVLPSTSGRASGACTRFGVRLGLQYLRCRACRHQALAGCKPWPCLYWSIRCQVWVPSRHCLVSPSFFVECFLCDFQSAASFWISTLACEAILWLILLCLPLVAIVRLTSPYRQPSSLHAFNSWRRLSALLRGGWTVYGLGPPGSGGGGLSTDLGPPALSHLTGGVNWFGACGHRVRAIPWAPRVLTFADGGGSGYHRLEPRAACCCK